MLSAPHRFLASYAVNSTENSYKLLWLRNYSSLATFFWSLTVKTHVQFVHSVTHCQLCKPQHTYVRRFIRKSHFKMNRVPASLPSQLLNRLQSVQNAAARLIFGGSRHVRVTHSRRSLLRVRTGYWLRMP